MKKAIALAAAVAALAVGAVASRAGGRICSVRAPDGSVVVLGRNLTSAECIAAAQP